MTEMLLALALSNRYWVRSRPPRYSVVDGCTSPDAASSVSHLQPNHGNGDGGGGVHISSRAPVPAESSRFQHVLRVEVDSRIASHEQELLQQRRSPA